VTQELEEKYGALLTRLDLRRGVPYTPNWSADADFIEIIVDACLRFKPGLILECSSGLTTLMLARCCQINGEGRLISLEDGLQYADNMRDYIGLYDLGGYATVVHAPLQELAVDGALYKWYATDAIPEAGIDMLVIDGPSGFIQKHSRYPALPVCMPRLAPGCSVYLDDAARSDERTIVSMWLARYPVMKHAYRDTSRGCSILAV
jgi:predicted O-methyltransferase YrrM